MQQQQQQYLIHFSESDRAALAMAACLTARLGRPSFRELAPDLAREAGAKVPLLLAAANWALPPGNPQEDPAATRQREKQHVQNSAAHPAEPNHAEAKKPSGMAADMR